ncbi:MAG TPA: hypothetical protein VMF69_10615 [Gemmataceae bacterium]|nr:hypothetical protein [Gemmataceae bacterium]
MPRPEDEYTDEPPRRRRREEEDDDEDDRPRRRRRAELNWLDKQFINTPMVLLVLFPLCCGWVALAFAIAGVAACQDQRARQRALIVLIISIIGSILGVVIVIVQRAAGR